MSATGVEAVRGAQVVCRVPVREPLDDKEVRRLYRGQYQDEPFVRIIAQRRGLYRLPEPKILSGTNYCDVGSPPTRRRPPWWPSRRWTTSSRAVRAARSSA
ncbi:hypothetical protein [Streptomyces sp. KL116D]|uniref:hypothetical protein n=1 Tax=Streptomyces sp. KL116D TaxID=3045152 RepID=UPI0035573F8D